MMMVEHVTTEQYERLIAGGQDFDGAQWLTTQSDLNQKRRYFQRVSTEPADSLLAKLDQLELLDDMPRNHSDIGSAIKLSRHFNRRSARGRTVDREMHKRSGRIDLAVVVVAHHRRPAVRRSRGDGTRTGGNGVSDTRPKKIGR